MDIKVQGLKERLKEFTRSELYDPFSRGSNSIETLSTGNTLKTLGNKGLKNINSVSGGGNNYYRFKDYTITFDDPSDRTSYPELNFSQGYPHELSIDYHYGDTWIYPSWPQTEVNSLITTFQQVDTSRDRGFLGDIEDENSNKSIGYTTDVQFDIWSGKRVSVDDPGNMTGHYGGGKLADYVSDQIVDIFDENKDELNEYGIKDAKISTINDMNFRKDQEEYRKLVQVSFSHFHEWS